MLSKESQKFIEEFMNDERYQTLCDELKSEDEKLGTSFEKIMDKACYMDENGTEDQTDETGTEKNTDEKTNEKVKKGTDGLAIYIGGIAKKKGY
jgi:hypothetical protein